MNTLIRCLRAAEHLRRPHARNTPGANIQHITFRDDVRTRAVAAWVLQSEVQEQLDSAPQARLNCPRAFDYYDLDTGSDSDSAGLSTQRAEARERRPRHCRRRGPRRKCRCVQRAEPADGYEAETETESWCKCDSQRTWGCQRRTDSADHGPAAQEIDEMFSGKASLCKTLRSSYRQLRCQAGGQSAARGGTTATRPFVAWD